MSLRSYALHLTAFSTLEMETAKSSKYVFLSPLKTVLPRVRNVAFGTALTRRRAEAAFCTPACLRPIAREGGQKPARCRPSSAARVPAQRRGGRAVHADSARGLFLKVCCHTESDTVSVHVPPSVTVKCLTHARFSIHARLCNIIQ